MRIVIRTIIVSYRYRHHLRHTDTSIGIIGICTGIVEIGINIIGFGIGIIGVVVDSGRCFSL